MLTYVFHSPMYIHICKGLLGKKKKKKPRLKPCKVVKKIKEKYK